MAYICRIYAVYMSYICRVYRVYTFRFILLLKETKRKQPKQNHYQTTTLLNTNPSLLLTINYIRLKKPQSNKNQSSKTTRKQYTIKKRNENEIVFKKILCTHSIIPFFCLNLCFNFVKTNLLNDENISLHQPRA